MANDSSLLTLTGMGVPPYSARGLVQTLDFIAEADAGFTRDVNGAHMDLGIPEFKDKFVSTISCSDMDAPAISGIFPGAEVTVECVKELSHPVGGSPIRPVVAGSLRQADGFEFYRPILTMIVRRCPMTFEEWNAVESWELLLVEK